MKSKVLLGLILLLGIFLRLYKLGEIPNGLYQDETAIGWNAYSILTTGKDEYSQSFPLYFKSFGDYKLPVYIYSTVVSEKLFGLTPFAVRFPSAFFGILTLPIFYLLIKQITKNEQLSLLSTLLLAINPWHLHYNRATFEVSIVLFLFTLGILLFYSAIEKKKGAFIGSIICFILALYSYNLTRLLSPMIFLGLVVLYRKNIKNISTFEKVGGIITATILLIPFVLTYFKQGGINSASGTLIFSSAAVKAPLLEFRSFFVNLPFINKFIFNSFTLIFWQYLLNVLSYFSIPFFFISGSQHGNHGIGTNGQLYVFEMPFVLWGIYVGIKKRQHDLLPFALVAMATILTAAITREAPHATRSFSLLLFFPLISAYGMLYAYTYRKKLSTSLQTISIISMGCIAIFSVLYYFLSYYVRFPIAYAKYWREEDKYVVEYIKNNQDKYKNIIIDKNSGFIYSSLLFYLPFSPTQFQQTVKRNADDSEGMSDIVSFGNIVYKEINFADDYKPHTLIITTPDKVPSNLSPTATFTFPMRPVVIALKQTIINYPVQEPAYVAIISKE